jgi:hypothetical protein
VKGPKEPLDSNEALEAGKFLENLRDCELLGGDSAPKGRIPFKLHPAYIKKSIKINIKFSCNRDYL